MYPFVSIIYELCMYVWLVCINCCLISPDPQICNRSKLVIDGSVFFNRGSLRRQILEQIFSIPSNMNSCNRLAPMARHVWNRKKEKGGKDRHPLPFPLILSLWWVLFLLLFKQVFEAVSISHEYHQVVEMMIASSSSSSSSLQCSSQMTHVCNYVAEMDSEINQLLKNLRSIQRRTPMVRVPPSPPFRFWFFSPIYTGQI